MSKLMTYEEMIIEPLWSTPEPGKLVKLACQMTMAQNPFAMSKKEASKTTLKFLVSAGHTSVLEHACICFSIQNVSRSLLAQLSRHRIASLTSQSQHYQDYRDVPLCMIEPMTEKTSVSETIDHIYGCYNKLRETFAKEEARQILPNAAAVNLIWTVNAREAINFLTQRLCWRNVLEMKMFADRIYTCCFKWWPNLFCNIGPACLLGHCNQGPLISPRCNGYDYLGAYHEENEG